MKKISPEVFTYYKKKLVYQISKWDIKDKGFNDVKLENYIWENGVKPWDRNGLFECLDETRNYILEKNLVTYNERLNLWFVSKRCRKSSFCREYETLYNLDKGLTNTVLRLNEIASDCGFREECADDKYFYPKPQQLLIRLNSDRIKPKIVETKISETYYKYFYRRLYKEYLNYFLNVEELNDW